MGAGVVSLKAVTQLAPGRTTNNPTLRADLSHLHLWARETLGCPLLVLGIWSDPRHSPSRLQWAPSTDGFWAECYCHRGLSVYVFVLSRIWLFVIPWTAACQAPLSMGFSRQEYWSGCHFLFQWIFPTQGSNPCLLGLLNWQAGSLPLEPPGKPRRFGRVQFHCIYMYSVCVSECVCVCVCVCVSMCMLESRVPLVLKYVDLGQMYLHVCTGSGARTQKWQF